MYFIFISYFCPKPILGSTSTTVCYNMNPFGHTFILQLLEVSTTEQKKVMAAKLSSHVMQLSLDPYGCYVIQKALQVVSRESCEQLVNGLKEEVIECIKSKHGNHAKFHALPDRSNLAKYAEHGRTHEINEKGN